MGVYQLEVLLHQLTRPLAALPFLSLLSQPACAIKLIPGIGPDEPVCKHLLRTALVDADVVASVDYKLADVDSSVDTSRQDGLLRHLINVLVEHQDVPSLLLDVVALVKTQGLR